ncbi:MAG: glycoside hydrolase family 95 protein [Lentimicrobiaceae bacterium]|nr:glycoside hydrolase family 95 protein [Lentimicrobiaceae bacterium]
MMKLILLLLVIYLIFKWNKMTFTYKCLTIALCIILIKIDKTDKKELSFYFEEPAQCWEETLPLGNGRLGIMPDGDISNETIVLNDITLWSGKVANYSNPKAKEALPEIQRLLLEGKNYEAQELVYNTFTCSNKGSNYGNGSLSNFGCFQTLGNIEIEYYYDTDFDIKDGSYIRKLDLNNAIATTEFETDKTRYRREYFVSRDADVAVIRLDAEKSKMISVDIQLKRQECVEYQTENNAIVMYGQLKDGSNGNDGMKYISKLTIDNEGGSIDYNDNKIVVRDADNLTLIFSSATNYKNENYTAFVDSLLNDAKSHSFNYLKKNHIKSYQELFNRVELDLGEGITDNHPIDDRLYAFQDEDDPQLAALYFHYGRYLFISSTKEDLLPPNLQGLWANTIQTPWNGDYHLNINVQMNHWLAEVCNLPELHEPLINFTKSIVKSGEETARDFYGAEGWTAHSICNLWGFTAPGEHPSWGATNTGGAWLCQHLFQHYLYNNDIEYLKEIYPTLKGAAQFFNSVMIEEKEHSWLVTAPTSSPENSFYLTDGRIANVCMGPTMDIQIITELYQNVIKASEILGIDNDFANILRENVKRFPPMQISEKGYLQEWLVDYEEPEIHHRHVSHLFGLHPGRLITKTQTPDLYESCRVSLERRGDEGTGWSRAWKINFWARLHDGERAYKLLKNLMTPAMVGDRVGAGTYPNLFCSHPPFQIDGNFGGTAGIAEMLIQSHDGFIELLPALPQTWKNGSFKGLCAENGAVVDCYWENGNINKIKIKSKNGGSYKILMPDGSIKNICLKKNQSKIIRNKSF